jgi:hypothetical protein
MTKNEFKARAWDDLVDSIVIKGNLEEVRQIVILELRKMEQMTFDEEHEISDFFKNLEPQDVFEPGVLEDEIPSIGDILNADAEAYLNETTVEVPMRVDGAQKDG